MDPLSVAGSIAGLVTLADAVFRGVYKYCKAAADAHTEIKELADRLRSLAGILHSLGILADALEQDGSYPTLQITLISDATKLLGEIQDHLNKPQMKMDGSRFGKIHQSLKWPFTKFKTKDFTEKLSQQQDIISLALDADTLKSLVELLSSSKDIQKQMESVQVGITNLQMLTRVEVDAERQRVLDFFLKVNPQSYLDTSLKLRHPGTGLWLTESVAFQQWIETTGSKIWLSGIPGAGKTVLTGAMVQKALEKGKGSPKIGVAFFFCDYKDPSTTVLSNILGAMASELARQSDQAFEKLKELFEILHPRDGLSRDAGSDIMHDHLENMFNCFDQVIMIIDGLDECSDNTDDIVQTLANIAEYSANVSMALVSRDEYNIAFNLRQSFTKIPVGARKEDILLYVGSEIDKRTRNNTLRITNVELKDEILTRLSNEADGMFRWVTCQLDYLCGCPTDADRREALKELPPTLDKTYERILRRINQSHPRVQKIVQRCLQLIGIASQFPIHINHLRWLVSIPETPNAICEENDIITEAEIAFQCSSLIRKSQDEYEFEFSHFTVREYLGRETLLDTLDFASYYVSDHIGYSALTQQYLKFLQLGNFHYKCHLDRDEQVKTAVERSTNFPLYPEAVARWLFTLRYGPLDPSTLKLAKSLFHPQKNPSFISWAAELIAQSMSHDPRALADPKSLQRATSLVTEPTFRTIHVAALLDLPEICEYLIQADHQWNSISPIGTPLECSISRIFGFMNQTWLPDPETACSMDYISYATHHPGKVTELLRTAGSIIQSPPDVYAGKYLMTCATLSAIVSLDFSPISSLVSTGWVVSDEEATIFDQAVELLLLKYPDEYLDSPCRQLEQLSASLRDLIESLNKFRIFDSNAGYNMCETAWTAAIKLGCNFTEEITLMDTRITLSLEALIRKCEFAIDNEDADLTQICLEDPRITGPEIDDDGTEKCGYSLLRRAIRMGSAKTVKMFHSVGYIMDKVSPDGSRPIHKAWNCREDIIELILGSGASHLDPDVDGNSVWHLAALNFEAETVSALIKLTGEGKISALRMQNNRGYTPLTLAIQALLDSHKEEEDDDEDDEDEDDDDDDETESIMSIIRETMETTVKLISDACEGDELCWQCTGSPWDLAAQSGSEVVVECLHNSSVHLAPIQEGCPTPLHALTHFASQACAEILINLYPMAKNMKYEGLIPLECMVRCCLRAGKIPQPGVIETLRCDSICATIPESNSALWESICSFCSKNLSSEFLILSNDQVLSLESIFLALASKEIFDAYEQLKNQCAAIPLFSALTALRYASPAFTHIFNEIISCTKLWTSVSTAQETIGFVKCLLDLMIGFADLQSKLIAEEAIITLLSRNVDVHLRHGPSCILEAACEVLDCGDKTGTTEPTSVVYESQRRVFTKIVDISSPERLNEGSNECLELIARKGYHHGFSWMIEKLVARGLDLNRCDSEIGKYLPFHVCVQRNATPAAISILELGANPSLRSWGLNALHATVYYGNLECLKHLFAKNRGHPTLWDETVALSSDTTQLSCTYRNMNALHISAARGHVECSRFLIEKGVFPDPTVIAASQYNCLHFAALYNQAKSIKYFCSIGLDINQPADEGSLPLHFAVRNGHEQAVNTLVTLGSTLPPDYFGMTPLAYAKKLGHTLMQQRLELAQSKFENDSMKNDSPTRIPKLTVLYQALEEAISAGDLDACKALKRRGFSMNMTLTSPDCDGCSPLLWSIRLREIPIASWFLEEHVSVLNIACHRHHSMSTLELAIQYWAPETVMEKILSIYVGTADTLDSIISSCFYAVSTRNHAALRAIINHVKLNLDKYSMVSGDSRETVLPYIISSIQEDGTLLHHAAFRSNLDALQILLEAGANVDALDSYNRTPLQVASDSRCVACLLAFGSKFGWLDPISWTHFNRMLPMLDQDVLKIVSEQARHHWTGNSRNFPQSTSWPEVIPYVDVLRLLQQNDLDLNSLGHSQTTITHYALCEGQSTSFLLNQAEIVESKPFPWHNIGLGTNELPWIGKHWRLFKKRVPSETLRYMMNVHPEQGISPLCQAAAVDALEVIDHCLEMGASIDFDGSSYGSALMAACANCRLKAVKHLVRHGASIVYHGEFGITSAIKAADGHAKITAWLLVGQFTEQTKLEYSSPQDPTIAPSIRPWSGIQEWPMKLTGYDEREPDEPLVEYVGRLAEIRDWMRGRMLPLRKDPLAGLDNPVCYRI